MLKAAFAFLSVTLVSQAQTPASAPPKPAPAKAKPAAAGNAMSPKIYADLMQLMRGIIYPASNVIFAAQNVNPNDVPPDKDPSTALNPLASAYGKWTAVENAGLALSESANLLIIPGRKCANGLPVPMSNPDWGKFVQGLREAGQVTLEAAKAKDQDKILDAADKMTTACSNCHEKWREKPELKDRCK